MALANNGAYYLQNNTAFDADDLNGSPISMGDEGGLVVWFVPDDYDGAVTIEATLDGNSWFEPAVYDVTSGEPATLATPTEGTAFFVPSLNGFTIRCRMEGGSDGSLTAFARKSHPLWGIRGA